VTGDGQVNLKICVLNLDKKNHARTSMDGDHKKIPAGLEK